MANLTDIKHINPAHLNVARPYALAAFEYAKDKQQLSEWKSYLAIAAFIATEPSVIHLLGNPDIPSATWFDLFQEILGTSLNQERQHFLSLLVQNNRLVILPEIATLFADYYAALEKSSHIRVITAISLDEEIKQSLAQALARRTERDITLQCEIDPAVLGGAVIYIDDRVIDGSIRGKLTRLLEFSLR